MQNILITGAATGIGLATSKALANAGYSIIAAVMPQQDCTELRQLEHVSILEADLSSRSDIAALIDSVTAIGKLDGIISCAGFAVPGPLELAPAELLSLQFQVNTFAPFHIIQGVLPLLRKSKGRVILIGAGQARVTLPYGGPYGASKAALSALADSLRAEVSSRGVFVSVIEPGAIKTGILKSTEQQWEKIVASASEKVAHDVLTEYRKSMDKTFASSRNAFESAVSPDVFAAFVLSVLKKSKPKPRYLFGKEARVLGFIGHLPAGIRAAIIAKMA